MTPQCPPNYACTFTPDRPPYDGPWWETGWGIAAVGTTILAVSIILIVLIVYRHEYRQDKRRAQERLAENKAANQAKVDLAEQFTLQLDTAKDNAELLQLIEKQQDKIRRY